MSSTEGQYATGGPVVTPHNLYSNTITSFGSNPNGYTSFRSPDITTRAVRLKAGWVGQVHLGPQIVWESKPKKSEVRALHAASSRVERKITALLAGDL